VRYIYIICIFLLQFAGSLTAAAEAPLPVKEVSHNKTASLSANDLLHHPAAEIVRSIQFNCIAFNARDQRDTEQLISSGYLSDYIGDHLRKRNIVFSFSHFTHLNRLLLFPNHYFW
jgi:hypothetical protein